MLCLFPVSTCLFLLMAASLCITLDCSASFCIPLCPPAYLARCQAGEQASILPAPPLGKQSNLREQGSLEAVPTLFAQMPFTPCVWKKPHYMYFLIMLLLAQVPFTGKRQVFLQCSSVFTALLVLAQRGCIWGHTQVVWQSTKALIFICFLIVHSISYNIIYFKRYLYILYYSQPFSSLAGSNPPAQDGALATGMWDRVLLSRDHSVHWGPCG